MFTTFKGSLSIQREEGGGPWSIIQTRSALATSFRLLPLLTLCFSFLASPSGSNCQKLHFRARLSTTHMSVRKQPKTTDRDQRPERPETANGSETHTFPRDPLGQRLLFTQLSALSRTQRQTNSLRWYFRDQKQREKKSKKETQNPVSKGPSARTRCFVVVGVLGSGRLGRSYKYAWALRLRVRSALLTAATPARAAASSQQQRPSLIFMYCMYSTTHVRAAVPDQIQANQLP